MCLSLRLAQLGEEMLGISSTCFVLLQRNPQVSLFIARERETDTEKVKGEKSLWCFLLRCARHIFLWGRKVG